MGALIFTIFTIIMVVSVVRDIVKKAVKPIAEDVESSEEEFSDQEIDASGDSTIESEDYLYYNMATEDTTAQKSQSSDEPKAVDVSVLHETVEYANVGEFNFDLRQAVISQTILQNDYVDNLK